MRSSGSHLGMRPCTGLVFLVQFLGISATIFSSGSAKVNCTVLEWNLGIITYFSEPSPKHPDADPAKEGGRFEMIAQFVFFDLDFRSVWDPQLRARWGSPLFFEAEKINPCLRIRPVFLDARETKRTAMMRSQVNSLWLYEDDMKVDAFVYDLRVYEDNIFHSSVVGKMAMGQAGGTKYNTRSLFPYFFRYGKNAKDMILVVLRYFEYFHWRGMVFITDQAQLSRGKFLDFMGAWTQANHSAEKLVVYNLPSAQLPYQTVAVTNIFSRIKAGTLRFVNLDLFNEMAFTADPQCSPLPFGTCVLVQAKREEIGQPTFQLLVNYELDVDAWFSLPEGWFERERIHFTYDVVQVEPGIFPRLLRELGDMAKKVKPSVDYVNAYTRYGLNYWEHDEWKARWENKALSGEAFGKGDNWKLLYRGSVLLDMMSYFVHALSDVMDTYRPTSKSQVTSEMFADAVGSAAPVFTLIGGNRTPFIMQRPKQAIITMSIVVQYGNGLLGQDGICCDETYYLRGKLMYSIVAPLWAGGNYSKSVPPRLNNCTPGQHMLPSGLCEWCRPGRFSNTFDETACSFCPRGKASPAKAEFCTDCEVGKVASETQLDSCTDCIVGSYAPSTGMTLCTLCEHGRYSGVRAAAQCNDCGGDLTTADVGSSDQAACVCPMGTFSRNFQKTGSSNGSVATTCEKCWMGLDCKSKWPDSWNAIGDPSSMTLPGFFTLSSAPYEPYKCCMGENCEEDCPGGPPESCIDGRSGLVCDECSKDGSFISGKECEECTPLLKLMGLIVLVMSCLLCCALYYLANGRLTVNADNPLAFFLFCGLIVTSAQIFGVLKSLSIPWPTSVNQFMTGSSAVFTLDADSVALQCAVGSSAITLYCVQVLAPYLILFEVCTLALTSKCVAGIAKWPSITWQKDKSFNVAGQVLQALFIAFCGIMLKPLQCFDHPNGKRSMTIYPRVLCDEGDDHSVLLILAACICFGFLLPFVTWCVWGCLKAPHESSINNFAFLQRYRFLLYRFRPDFWWWGLCFMSRQTLLSLAIVLPNNNPHAQLFYTGGVLAIYGFLVTRVWPWISGELSVLDAGTMLVLVLLMLNAAQFLPEPQPSQGRISILVALFLTMTALFSWFAVLVARSVCARGIFGEFGGGSVDRMSISNMWLQWLEYSHNVPNAEIVETICRMNAFDRKTLINFITCWNAVTGQGVEGTKWRLRGLPSRSNISKESTMEVARSSSRISTQDFGNQAPLDDSEFPRSLCVLSSAGTAPSNSGAKPEASSKEVSTHTKPMI